MKKRLSILALICGAGLCAAIAGLLAATGDLASAQDESAGSKIGRQQADVQQLLDVPDGTIVELIVYLTEVVSASPGDRSPAEARDFLRKTSTALLVGADKLLALEPDDKQTALAYRVKILSSVPASSKRRSIHAMPFIDGS